MDKFVKTMSRVKNNTCENDSSPIRDVKETKDYGQTTKVTLYYHEDE